VENQLVSLFDVDNTLLDHDSVSADLRKHLQRVVGADRAQRYWELFEQIRSELGYADYLGALQRYRLEHPRDENLLEVSYYLLRYPFANRLLPGSIDAVQHAQQWGTAAILSETQSRALNVHLAELALLRMGARPFHVVMPTPRNRNIVPVRSTGASEAIQRLGPVISALQQAGFVVDCTIEGLMHAVETPEILKAGARILVISNEHPEALERMVPDPALEKRVRAAAKMLRGTKRMRVTSKAGTALDVDMVGASTVGVWGWTDKPGTLAHWPGGIVVSFPKSGTINGTLVMAPGDINLTFKRYLTTPVKMILKDDKKTFDESVTYIYRKQLEEAGIIVVNKIDLVSLNELTEVKQLVGEKYSDKTILYQNSQDKESVHQWLKTLNRYTAVETLRSLAIDYDIYAAGEAKLAWFDQVLELISSDNNAIGNAELLINTIFKKINERGYNIGHLKFFIYLFILLFDYECKQKNKC